MDRRKFLKSTCAVCGVAIAGGILLDSCKKDVAPFLVNFTLDLANPANEGLNSVGGYVYNNSVIIARVAAPLLSSSFVALSQVCTHAGCTVEYNSGSNNFNCPCHQGQFDISGNVISGPPPSALAKYNISLNGTILTVNS